jgi:hypothetical protein
MLKSWGSLKGHGRLVGTLWVAGTTWSDGTLAALWEGHIIKVSHGRPIGSPSAKLLAVRSLHVGDSRVVQEIGGFLGTTQPRRRTGRRAMHQFRHQARGRTDSARRLLGWAARGECSNTNLLHESKQMLSLAWLGFSTCQLGKGILIYRTCVILSRIEIPGRG